MNELAAEVQLVVFETGILPGPADKGDNSDDHLGG